MISLGQQDQKTIWHPYTQMQGASMPIAITKASGVYLYDENGKAYIDAISSWWVNLHGHCHPHIAQKIFEQANCLEHTLFAGFTHKAAVDLASALLKQLPSTLVKIFYSDNGSTAVEVAIKMALQFWSNQNIKKINIIAFEQAYHGDTFGAMSVSHRGSFTKAFQPYLFDVITIPYPQQNEAYVTINALKKIIQSNKNIAAFIFEPLILGAGGMLMYSPEVLTELLLLCKQNNILTIADEVMTGFYRTGKFLATDYVTTQPDIVCLSKGLTGGYLPLSITACSEMIYNAFLSDSQEKTFFHGHSYTANPLACAAALASLDLLLTQQTLQSIENINQQHQIFADKYREHNKLTNLRVCGTILAMDVKTNETTSYFNPLRDRLYNFFIDQSVLLRPLGNTIYCMPPYCITTAELNTIYGVIIDAVNSL